MKTSLISLSKPVHAMLTCTNSIRHAHPLYFTTYPHTQYTDSPRPSNPPSTQTTCRPTNGAVFSIPARAAFTFAVLACAVLVAARVTRPLVTPCARPAVVAAAGARHTDAMATTVGCTNLCGRHRERRREGEKMNRKGRGSREGVGWTGKKRC